MSVPEIQRLVEAGKLEEALERIDALPRGERESFPVLNLLGIINAACGGNADAAQFFLKALELEPGDADCWYNLACVCKEMGDRENAQAALDNCARLAEEGSAEDGTVHDLTALQKELSAPAPGAKPRRVLFVAYYYPPLAGSGVYRSLKFAKYLHKFGWEPTVISTNTPPKFWDFTDESLTREVEFLEPRVTRIPDPMAQVQPNAKVTMTMEQVQRAFDMTLSILKNDPKANEVLQILAKRREDINRLISFPCPALRWSADVVRHIDAQMDMSQFDAVYTTSGPSSAHLIGYYLKTKYGTPWVADFRDPWTLNAYKKPYDPQDAGDFLLRQLEEQILRKADRILFTSEEARQAEIDFFQVPARKILTITNGYDESDLPEWPGQEKNKKFTITYTGLLYTGQDRIAPLLSGLKDLIEQGRIDGGKLLLRFAGNDAEAVMRQAEEFQLAACVETLGYIPHAQALQLAASADIQLIMVGDDPKYKFIHSGKLFDCLYAGTPILAFAPEDGVIDRVLTASGHGKAVRSTDTEGIRAFLLERYAAWEASSGKERLQSPQIELYERQYLTARLARVLNDAIAENGEDQ